MIKSNLPVILLKGLVLLPHQEARIELNNDISKKVIDIAKEYHNNEILIVTPLNILEENPSTDDLPKIGVVGVIKSKIDLPNGTTRIVITGKKRVKVYSYVNYSNQKDILESIVASIPALEVDEIEETALLRTLITELDKYISLNPYISNSILSQIKGITDLDKLTDMITSFLPLSFEKKLTFMLNTDYISRAKKLITEINIEKAVVELENKIELELKQKLEESQKEFILKEKIKLIKTELGEKDSKTESIESIREKMSLLKLPVQIKNKLENELDKYERTPDVSPELAVIKNYIDVLLSLPWNNRSKDEKDLNKILDNLNSSHYGLIDIKNRIIEYIAVKENNKNAVSPIICLVGPPGVGKTTFAESIAKSLNRSFSKISLGGIGDPAELIGHRKTYIGSSPGKIINSYIKCGTKNPVILLDEIDKLTKDYRGDPASTLLDVLDSKQNKSFVDNYIEEGIDLSEVFFICTANDLTGIPPVLRDRLEIIEIAGYTDNEKLNIATTYLIPNALINSGLKEDEITFDEKSINEIINSYTKESGVRELDKLINKIIRKIITDSKMNNKEIIKSITIKNVSTYLKSPKYSNNTKHKIMPKGFITGIAYTPYGGSTIEVEVSSYPGKEEFCYTGSLGKVMEESIKVAIGYIKSNLVYFNLKNEVFKNKTYHINFRETAVPKEGPSAGSLIVTALLSYIKNKNINSNISMTGEITLNGDILPIGGLKEKSLAAIRNGIDTIFIPKENEKDALELDEDIKCKIKFIPVKNYKEIYKYIFK